jgi:hypothetical protein
MPGSVCAAQALNATVADEDVLHRITDLRRDRSCNGVVREHIANHIEKMRESPVDLVGTIFDIVQENVNPGVDFLRTVVEGCIVASTFVARRWRSGARSAKLYEVGCSASDEKSEDVEEDTP